MHSTHYVVDKTTRDRQARRRAQLDEIARRAGYDSWSNYETQVLKKVTRIDKQFVTKKQ